MKIKSQLLISRTILILILILGYNIKESTAGSPWLWDRVLKQDKAQDAMKMPTSLFIDTKKELYYVVDSGRNRLLSFNRKGVLLQVFNAGKALKIPYDIVKTDEKGLWVVEKENNSLSYIDLKEKKVTPNTLSYQDRLIYPDRLEANSGLLYVLDKATGDILSFSDTLEAVTRFSCSECSWGFVDFKLHDNKVWALDQAAKTIRCFNLDGELIKTFELGGGLVFPVSLDIGPSGFIYVLDRHKRNIAVYDRHGIFKYRFLEKGITQGRLYYPTELRFDPWGGLCVVDEGSGKVEIYRR